MVLLKPEHLLRLPAALLCSTGSTTACSSRCRSIGSATACLCCPRTKVQMAEGQGQDNGGGTVCSEGAPCAQMGAPAGFKLPWWQPVSDLRRPPALL